MKKVMFPLFLVALLLSGCATTTTKYNKVDWSQISDEARTQKIMAIRTNLERQKRLLDVAYPLFMKNASLCEPLVRKEKGLFIASKYHYEDEAEREIYAEAYNLGEYHQILIVPKGSPAEKAGLLPGDSITAINNQPLDAEKLSKEDLTKLLTPDEDADTPLILTIRRGDETMKKKLVPETFCDSHAVVFPEGTVNALTNGEVILVTYGLLRFVDNDDELAMVLAHELGHNVMGHQLAKSKNMKIGGAFGILLDVAAAAVGVNTNGNFTRMGMNTGMNYGSQDFEREADYVGMYLLARSGYEIDKVPNLWRRMAVEHPDGIEPNHRGTHPSSAERFANLEKDIEEVHQKIQEGAPLLPENWEERSLPIEKAENTAPQVEAEQ